MWKSGSCYWTFPYTIGWNYVHKANNEDNKVIDKSALITTENKINKRYSSGVFLRITYVVNSL